MEYDKKYRQLLEYLNDPKYLNDPWKYGFMRNGAIDHFNGIATGMKSPTTVVLSTIQYAPNGKFKDRRLISDRVREVFVNFPWFQTYGLDYNQTMELPFDEFERMLEELREKQPPEPETVKVILPEAVNQALHGVIQYLFGPRKTSLKSTKR